MAEVEFVPECNVDTLLVELLGVPRKRINHADGNHRVARALREQEKLYHKVVIGITDLDKENIPKYFNEFTTEVTKTACLIHKAKPDTKKHIIFLKPAIEAWILKAAEQAGIKPEDFGFPSKNKELKRITTQEGIGKDEKFRAFLQEIKNKDPENFKELRAIVNQYYKPSQY
jgi:transketolase